MGPLEVLTRRLRGAWDLGSAWVTAAACLLLTRMRLALQSRRHSSVWLCQRCLTVTDAEALGGGWLLSWTDGFLNRQAHRLS